MSRSSSLGVAMAVAQVGVGITSIDDEACWRRGLKGYAVEGDDENKEEGVGDCKSTGPQRRG